MLQSAEQQLSGSQSRDVVHAQTNKRNNLKCDVAAADEGFMRRSQTRYNVPHDGESSGVQDDEATSYLHGRAIHGSQAMTEKRPELPLGSVLGRDGMKLDESIHGRSSDWRNWIDVSLAGLGDMMNGVNIGSTTTGSRAGTSKSSGSSDMYNANTLGCTPVASTFGSHACPGVNTPSTAHGSYGEALPASSAQFAYGIRAKLAEVLPALVSSIPLGEARENIHIAEFGCLNSRSVYLIQVVIDQFLSRLYPRKRYNESRKHAFPHLEEIEGETSNINFVLVHEDSPQADFRSFVRMLNTAPESYMNPTWLASRHPSLQNSAFPMFVARPFGSRIMPRDTFHLGFSLMDLHWTHTPKSADVSLATTAHAELHAFLATRAHEFRRGSIFIVAFISRLNQDNRGMNQSTDGSSTEPAIASAKHGTYTADDGGGISPTGSHSATSALNAHCNNDIWTTLTELLVPCLQRLVSCGMLKSDVARQMLTLPLHPRTPAQTRRVLKQLSHLWDVKWSCGLGIVGREYDSPDDPVSIPEPLRLPHPACAAFNAGVLHPSELSEQLIHLLKNLYETHFRMILRERGKLSKGAVEFILDSLWDIAQSRILDHCMFDKGNSPFSNLELGVQLFALRRL